MLLPLRFDVDLRAVDFRAVGLRVLPALAREADERLLAAVLDRDPLPEARVAPLRGEELFALLLDREEPLDERVLCPPPEDFVAMLSSPSRTCVL